MRAFLILTVSLSVLAGCNPPHYDLTKPIYFVAEKSFWDGCEEHSGGYMACMAEREHIFHLGLNQWFRHFDSATRPVGIMVYPEEMVPDDAENEVIKLRVGEDDNCHGKWVACYSWTIGSHPTIVFRDPKYEDVYKIAHEFGHAIGSLGHVTDRMSIMSPTGNTFVTPLDMTEMCAVNGTCPPFDAVWCKGSHLYDEGWCPPGSTETSPDEAWARLNPDK
jgi:hypothetical protein